MTVTGHDRGQHAQRGVNSTRMWCPAECRCRRPEASSAWQLARRRDRERAAMANLKFSGPRACRLRGGCVRALYAIAPTEGDILVSAISCPRGGPGMREMLAPRRRSTARAWGLKVALITDGRFSGATRGFCIGHVGPEAAIVARSDAARRRHHRYRRRRWNAECPPVGRGIGAARPSGRRAQRVRFGLPVEICPAGGDAPVP